MAKERRVKFVIDTKEAQKNLDQGAKKLDKFNQQMAESIKHTRSLNRLQANSRTRIKEHSQATSGATRAMKNFTKEMRNLTKVVRDEIKAQTLVKSAVRNTRDAYTGITTSTNTAASSHRQLTNTVNDTTNAYLNLAAAQEKAKRTSFVQAGGPARVPTRAKDFGGGFGAAASPQLQGQIRDMKNLSDATEDASKKTKDLTNNYLSFQSAARIVIALAIHRAFLRLAQAIRDSAVEAVEFNRRITEIRTISDRAAMSTDQWGKSLQQVARSYGIDQIEAAEGAYQALSNQVVDATSATQFLREEIKLAITGVASLDQAVAATTAILNAYGLESGNAAEVNAILFKSVELGRLRLSELGDTIGRVSILSSQLGVSFVEQQAAITLLTRQGIKAEEAITLLRNVELKLIKPTERMKDIFQEWGVTSGQAAVQAFGLAGVMNKLAKEAQKSGDISAEMGEIFGRLRAIVGAVGLSANDLNAEIKKFGTAGVDQAKAVEEAMGSMAKRADVAVQEMKILFVEEFGKPLVELGLSIADTFGGADNALRFLLDTTRRLVTAYLAYRAAVVATTISQAAFKAQLAATNATATTTGTILGGNLVKALSSASAGAALAQGAFAALAVLVSEMAIQWSSFESTVDSTTSKLQIAADRLADSNLNEFNANQIQSNIALQNEINNTFRTYLSFTAGIRAETTRTSSALETAFTSMAESLKKGPLEAVKGLRKELDGLLRKAEEARREGETRAERVARESRDEGFRRAFDSAKAPGEEASLTPLKALRDRLSKSILATIGSGNFELADEIKKRFDAVDAEITRRLESIKRKAESMKTVTEDVLSVDSQGRVTTKKERTQQVTDPAKAKAAAQELARDEARRQAFTTRRLAAEKAQAELLKRNGEAQVRALTRQKKALQEYEAALERITKLKFGDVSVDEFAKQRSDVLSKGRSAGINKERLANVGRQLGAQQTRLEQDTIAEAQRKQIDAAEKGIKELQQRLAETSKTAQAAAKDSAVKILSQIPKELANVEGRLRAFDRNFSAGNFFATTPADKALLAARNSLKDIKDTLIQIAGAKGFTETNEGIQKFNKQLSDVISKLQQLDKVGKNAGFGQVTFGLRSGTLATAPVENNSLVLGTGEDSETVEEQIQRVAKVQAELAKASRQYQDSQKAIVGVRKELFQAQKAAESIPEEYKKAAEEAARSAQGQNNALQSTARQATNTVNRLKAIEQQHKRNAAAAAQQQQQNVRGVGGFFASGKIQYRAGGGPIRGTDRYGVMLSRGESVINAQASRMFAPLLSAINSSAPGFGQSNINFGDITINAPQGTSSDQAEAIVEQLQRRARRGLSTFGRS